MNRYPIRLLATVLLATMFMSKLNAQTTPPGIRLFTNVARNISFMHPSANVGIEIPISDKIALSTDIGMYYYHYVLGEPTNGLSVAVEGRYFFRRKWWFGVGLSGARINYSSADALISENEQTGHSQPYSVKKGLLLGYGLFGYRKFVGEHFFFGPQLGLGLGFMDNKMTGRAPAEEWLIPVDINIRHLRDEEGVTFVPTVKPGFVVGYRFSK